MKLKYYNASENANPKYTRDGDAGIDIRANLTNNLISEWRAKGVPCGVTLEEGDLVVNYVTLKKGMRLTIPTGLYLEIPPGYEGNMRSRSGLSSKFGVVITNSPGTIDSNYRGEIHLIIEHSINNDPTMKNDNEFIIKQGDRLGQLVIAKCETVEFIQVSKEVYDDDTNRGADGLGSSGIK